MLTNNGNLIPLHSIGLASLARHLHQTERESSQRLKTI